MYIQCSSFSVHTVHVILCVYNVQYMYAIYFFISVLCLFLFFFTTAPVLLASVNQIKSIAVNITNTEVSNNNNILNPLP